MRTSGTFMGILRWHSQNLCTVGEHTAEGYRERVVGSMARHGRAWFYPGATVARRQRRYWARFRRALKAGEVTYSRQAAVLVPVPEMGDDDELRDHQNEAAWKLAEERAGMVERVPFPTGARIGRTWRCIALAWSFLRRHAGTAAHVSVGDGDSDVQLHIALGRLASVFLSFEGYANRALECRQWGISIHDQAVWLTWGDNPWNGTLRVWHYVDWLLGRQEYASEDVRTRDVRVPFEEGTYTARVRLTRDTWKRPRWPWPLVVHRAHIDVLGGEGIPVPVNPDSDFAHLYRDGTDAVYSLTCRAKDEREAVAALRESVERDRERHGWANAGGTARGSGG
jgi:hypothetical protein